MTTASKILFVCEHGAAKSIIAAAWFNKLAHENGINLQAVARGTSPDDELSPITVQGLTTDGLTSTEVTPQKLLAAEIQSAQRVITFGDLFNKEDHQDVKIENWNDVPPVSRDYQIAREVIMDHLTRLLADIGTP
jgi:arsenate reductase (thioredoxin)